MFRAVVIPSCTYGRSAISNQLCEDNYDFLDVVPGRLVKLWFGVSKFASTSSLVNAVEWEKASDLVRTSHETHTALGPVSMPDYTLSCRSNFPTGIKRRNIGCVPFHGDGFILYVAFKACVYAKVVDD